MIVLSIGLLIGLLSSCSKVELPGGTPECIEQLTKELRNEEVRNPPSSITRYTWDGEYFYYVPSECCDAFSSLYDSDCNYICAPDGGFAGVGDGNCPEFWADKEDSVIIWEDDRE
ncbi:MAG: hypothetical protein ACI959_001987 [Limisphaerales bacterium]|jgi:hypothetical protein